MTAQLDRREAAPADLLIRSAHVLDPRTGIDAPRDLLIRGGKIAEVGEPGSIDLPDGCEDLDASGLHALPAFVDPHVHLRTPGREDEEDIASGTRSAAAGGFCAILAMPNTDPVVSTEPVLSSLRESARREAHVPVGFLASITRDLRGEELTEMAELADAGAIAFTDDGVPVHDSNVLRQALQYQRLAGKVLALHEEDPSLSGEGVMHEGEVSAVLGMEGVPSLSESLMIARDAALAKYEDGHDPRPARVRARVRRGDRARKGRRHPHHRGGQPAPPLPHPRGRARARPARFKMNPPLRSEDDRQALIAALKAGTLDCIATDHAPHSREEKEQPWEAAPNGVTGLETSFAAVHTELVLPGIVDLATIIERMTSGGEPFDIPAPRIEPGADANVALVDLAAEWEVGEAGYESRSTNCAFAGRTLTGRVRMTVAAGAVAYRERSFAIGAVA